MTKSAKMSKSERYAASFLRLGTFGGYWEVGVGVVRRVRLIICDHNKEFRWYFGVS